MGRDPARPGAEPMKGQREELPSSPRNRQGEGRGNSSYTHAASRTVGLSPEQMEVGFPNQSHCNSPRQSPPWAHGWEDCKAVQKTNLHRRLRQTGLTLLVAPRNRQWSYFLPSDEDGGCWKTQVPVTQPERMCFTLGPAIAESGL